MRVWKPVVITVSSLLVHLNIILAIAYEINIQNGLHFSFSLLNLPRCMFLKFVYRRRSSDETSLL